MFSSAFSLFRDLRSCVASVSVLRFGAVLSAAAALVALAPAALGAQQLYTCGMHPQVIKTEPGDCPICHMKLTPLLSGASDATGQAGGGSAAAALATIRIDPGIVQRMNLRTEPVVQGAARRDIRTVGFVAFDERTRIDITTRYDGWIEKLFVNASWQRVKQGDPLFEIYSPALYNAQLNYLTALRSSGDQADALASASRDRLQLLGVSDAFIDELGRSGKAERNYIYRAPADGVVVEKLVNQGQMINAGQPIYRFAELSQVWVLAQVYEKDIPLVKAGQPVQIRGSYASDSMVIEANVDEVLPQIDESTRSAVARIVLDNAGEALLPGMFVDVRFGVDLGADPVLVAEEAVLRSGETNTVFVALGEGRFEPRKVELGARTHDNRYVVTDGLHAGETVVVSGQFMLDSESRLREAIAKMINAATADSGASGVGAVGVSAAAQGAEATAAELAAMHAAMGHSHGNLAASSSQPPASQLKNSAHVHAVAAPQSAGAATAVSHDACAHGAGSACCSSGVLTAGTAQTGGAVTSNANSVVSASASASATASAAGSATGPASDAAALPQVDACCVAGAHGHAASSATSGAEGVRRQEQMRKQPLVVLAFSAADAASALSADDLAGYRQRLPQLRKALADYVSAGSAAAGASLAPFAAAGTLPDPQSLAAARQDFAPFSNALATVVEASGLHRSRMIHLFECPMVPRVGTGRWLQRGNDNAYNPFFGADMLHCGGIVQ